MVVDVVEDDAIDVNADFVADDSADVDADG